MKITLGAAMALALLMATVPAGSAPEDDRNNLIRILRERYPGVPLSDYVHGALTFGGGFGRSGPASPIRLARPIAALRE